MAVTSKLTVYNDALRELGSHPLANLTTANTRLQELEGAFPHAIEYLISRADWNFARRRATLTGVADTSFSPYTYRYARPSDYLRKLWIKTAATDDFEIEHAEIGAVFYGYASTALIEYVSDTSQNYDPANWPPHFTRCAVIYLALLVAPKLARTGGNEDVAAFYGKLDRALADAERLEAVQTTNENVSSDRLPVMRRALEIMGQAYDGSVALSAQAGKLRAQMNKSWDDTVSYLLEQGVWNFATKRAYLVTGADGADLMPGEASGGIIEGYSVGTGDETPFDSYAFAGFTYAWYLPTSLRRKIWLKTDAATPYEVPHQIVRDAIFTNADPCVLEYIAEDSWTTDPDNWPFSFRELVAARLASVVVPELVIEQDGKGGRVTASGLRDKLTGYYERALADARIKDAVQQYPKVIPPGSFVLARRGGRLY